jgi:hypothetical protein
MTSKKRIWFFSDLPIRGIFHLIKTYMSYILQACLKLVLVLRGGPGAQKTLGFAVPHDSHP